MRIDRYLQHVPEIERRIVELKPDAIVFGMGPTAWLLPWIDQRLLEGVRLWTCHDGCRIRYAHDLVLLDEAARGLHPLTDRYTHIVQSRPQRIWCYKGAWEPKRNPNSGWKHHLDKAVLGLVKVQDFFVWTPTHCHPQAILNQAKLERTVEREEKDAEGRKVKVSTGEPLPDTSSISPTGTAVLAWQQGARRIGILGVDMLPEHGHSSTWSHPHVDCFFYRMATLAHERGGAIRNLSPICTLKGFAKWKPPEPKPSASLSEPITVNGMLVPSVPSKPASEETAPAA